MSRHKHYHIPDREARRAAQLERKPDVEQRVYGARSRGELVVRRAGRYVPHQSAAEKARRLAQWVRDSRLNPDALETVYVDLSRRASGPLIGSVAR